MTNIFQKFFLTLALALTLFAPKVAMADACSDLKTHFPTTTLSQDIGQLPEYCNVESVYKKIINIALYAIGIVSVIVIIYGGYVYMTSGGNEEQRKRGRLILTWAIIGLIIVLAASALVNAVVTFVVEN